MDKVVCPRVVSVSYTDLSSAPNVEQNISDNENVQLNINSYKQTVLLTLRRTAFKYLLRSVS